MNAKRWLPVLVVILLLSLFLESYFLMAITITLLVLLGMADWWQKHALDRVTYKRRFHFTRAFPGEQVPLQVMVENRKLLPLSWLRVEDPWPKVVAPEDENLLAPSHLPDQGLLTNLFTLRWFERARRRYSLLFRERGVYTVGPATLESGDLFGIFQQSRTIGSSERLTVFPALISIPEIELPAENPFGDLRSRRRLFEDPNRPMGVREYRPEDGFRRVHWPATARTGELQVKVYQPTTAQMMVICLNVSTHLRYWEGIYPELLEQLVSTAATLAYQGVEKGYRVGIISNGSLSNSDQPFRLAPSRNTRQLAHILETLAGVTPITVAPFERFLMKEAPRVPYGSTLVVVTALTPPELSETLLKLKRHERRILLFSLAEEPPSPIPGIHSLHLPFEHTRFTALERKPKVVSMGSPSRVIL